MKIVAGWKLYRRNPNAAPATIAQMAAASVRPSDAERIANVSAEIPQKPAASPSMPSMKLTMLAIATIQSTVSGYCHQPRSKTPSNGSVTWSMVMPSEAGMAAIAIMPGELDRRGAAGGCRRARPAPPSARRPAMIPQKPWSSPSAQRRDRDARRRSPGRPAAASAGVQAAGVGRAVDDAEPPGGLRHHRRQQHGQQERDREADDRPPDSRSARRLRHLERLFAASIARAGPGTGDHSRAEQPVAGVAQAGQDVAVLVQPAVERPRCRRHVRVRRRPAGRRPPARPRSRAGASGARRCRLHSASGRRPSRRWRASGRAAARRARPGRRAACCSTRPAPASARRGRGRRSRPGRPGSGRAPRRACPRRPASPRPRPASCPTPASRRSRSSGVSTSTGSSSRSRVAS